MADEDEPQQFEIQPLDLTHDREAFCCGNDYIDDWCKRKAHKDHEKYKSRVFVATEKGQLQVVGIYCLTIRSLQPKRIPDIGFGRRDIPAIYFATLGVSQTFAKRGLGTALMTDAFQRVLRVSEEVGTYCLWLECVDEPTVHFYNSLGFQRIEKSKLDMYVPLETIRDAFS